MLSEWLSGSVNLTTIFGGGERSLCAGLGRRVGKGGVRKRTRRPARMAKKKPRQMAARRSAGV